MERIEERKTEGYAIEGSRAESVSNTLMRKAFTWMALALAITGITSYMVADSETLISLILGNRFVFYGLLIAEFALVIGISAAIQKISFSTAVMLYVLYSVVNGITLSSIFLVYTAESITSVFFITAGTFAVMAFLGYTTKTDLTSFGKILLMALVGMILATIVNMFIGSTGFARILNYAGVLIFVGLTAYDTQKLKNLFAKADGLSEGWQKIAILGALTLYLDFINLFLKLLSLFGKKK